MSRLAALFEPEELIGSLWHRTIGDKGKEIQHPEAAVILDLMMRRLSFFFRALGGHPAVEIKPIAQQKVEYRQKWLSKIGHVDPVVTKARFDGDFLFLPQVIALLPQQKDNEMLYKWLVVWAVTAAKTKALQPMPEDPLQKDIAFLRFQHVITQQILTDFPGMKKAYQTLCPKLLENRTQMQRPLQEAAIENCIQALLQGDQPLFNQLSSEEAAFTREIWTALQNPEASLVSFNAVAKYATFLPVALWGERTQRSRVAANERDAAQPAASDAEQQQEEQDGRTHQAKREKSDQIERKDSLLLYRFEAILSWAEMMNLNRGVDDDDEHTAQRALDDHEEIGLVNISKKAATKLKFDLDLAPEDVEHEAICDQHTYPEWDYRSHSYYQDHCRVLAAPAPLMEAGKTWQPDKEARKRIRAVKRQFEALRPRRERFYRQADGEDIDMDAALRAHCDFVAFGESSDKVFSTMRDNSRDLSVSILIDVSRSTESWVEGKQVIEIARETLMALALGLEASGDDNALYSFSSLRRDRVTVSTLKDFSEPLGAHVFSRIGALTPGFYTRLGAAIRHVSEELSQTPHAHRLLLVLTDGKPNDLDHYEGRYGIEDSMMAVREARRAGMSVFGITIDKQEMMKKSSNHKLQNYFAYIFGQNAHAMIRDPQELVTALPLIYRHLVT